MEDYHNIGELDITSFTYKNDAQEFIWKKHKFSIKFACGCLPPETPSALFEVYASFGDNFILPEKMTPVSAFFAIKCNREFLKSVSVSIEHCAVKTKHLRFAVCSSPFPPYEFEETDKGNFTKGCGTIERTRFSIFVVAFKKILFSRKAPISYFIAMYTKRGENDIWEVYLYIIKNLQTIITELEEEALKKGLTRNTHTSATLPKTVKSFKLHTSFDEEEKEKGWRNLSSGKDINIARSRIDGCPRLSQPAIFKVRLTKRTLDSSLEHNYEIENAEQENSLTLTLAQEGKRLLQLFKL